VGNTSKAENLFIKPNHGAMKTSFNEQEVENYSPNTSEFRASSTNTVTKDARKPKSQNNKIVVVMASHNARLWP